MDVQEQQEKNPQANLSRNEGKSEEGAQEEAEAPKQMSLQEVLDTFNQRLGQCEGLLTELMKAFQMSGQAINRLESFTFAQMKVLLEKEITNYEEFLAFQKELQTHDDLHAYWGVTPPENQEEVSEDDPGTSSEE